MQIQRRENALVSTSQHKTCTPTIPCKSGDKVF